MLKHPMQTVILIGQAMRAIKTAYPEMPASSRAIGFS